MGTACHTLDLGRGWGHVFLSSVTEVLPAAQAFLLSVWLRSWGHLDLSNVYLVRSWGQRDLGWAIKDLQAGWWQQAV